MTIVLRPSQLYVMTRIIGAHTTSGPDLTLIPMWFIGLFLCFSFGVLILIGLLLIFAQNKMINEQK